MQDALGHIYLFTLFVFVSTATLFLIATYSIGKERILMELARRGHYPMVSD